ncbi:lytic transglycosylase domain-containing protein [Burkholderia ubonensis]|uniref:lytic transglycosylase domain-containing protein n=1 Tax=Burkholderia ubonensis TaxID=101571 RepID=UPI0009B3AEB6|nr:lytic transglycosylase domain-containing protein [Burkholderia ubonensis]
MLDYRSLFDAPARWGLRWAPWLVSTIVLSIATPAWADCIDTAATRHGVNSDLLRAIGYFESSLNPAAVHKNANGTVDIGLMQINSVHLPVLARYGIDRAKLSDGCVSAEVGAALLQALTIRYGPTWQAVGEYHSHTPRLREAYARSIHDIYVKRPWERGKASLASDR